MTQLIRFSENGQVLTGNSIVPTIHVISQEKLSPLLSDSFLPIEALQAIDKHKLTCRFQPIAVIGPKQPEPQQYQTAEQIGHMIATWGLPLLCGGADGIMEAAAKGASKANGVVIGLLPDDSPKAANAYVNYVLPSGIGKARNAIIAQAAACLVAIGGGHGTMTEMAFGIHFNKRVFALPQSPYIPDVEYIDNIEVLKPLLLAAYFQGETE